MTRSMSVVVPPASAAAVPDSKSSADTVPMNGNARWTCGSTPPGSTYCPEASMTSSLDEAFSRFMPTAAIFPSWHRTSAWVRPPAFTTVPFLINTPAIAPSSDLDHGAVRLGPAIAVELPGAPHFLDHVEVHLGDDELVLVLAPLGEEVAARVDEVGAAVELADVPRRLGADPVARAHEVAVGH